MFLKFLLCYICSSVIIIKRLSITRVFSTHKILLADLPHSTCVFHISRFMHPFLCNWNAFPLPLCLSKSYACVKVQIVSHFFHEAFSSCFISQWSISGLSVPFLDSCYNYFLCISGWIMFHFPFDSRNNDLYFSCISPSSQSSKMFSMLPQSIILFN